MKFIVDAQLPIKLKIFLLEKGHDVIHTNDLPKKQFTTDFEIIKVAEKEKRIIISKDSDFYKHYLINSIPSRILFITTGNIRNKELLHLLDLNFEIIEKHFLSGKSIIELNNNLITVYV